MSVLQTIRIAWRALGANKLRTSLAMLGIIFGVASVIAIMSFGSTFKGLISSQVNDMGAGVLFIMSGDASISSAMAANTLTLDDEKALLSALPVDKSGAFTQTSVPLVVGDQKPKFSLALGANENFEALRNWHVTNGRFFTKAEVESKAPVVVIGQALRDALFGKDADPLGKQLMLKGKEVQIIGMLAKNPVSMGAAADDVAIFPITLLSDQIDVHKVTGIMVRFKDPRDAKNLKEQVKSIVLARHGIEDFSIQDQQELLKTFTDILDKITIFVGAVAAIALLVGGIGIMNIMLVSVKERTREIGIRKAIGARPGDILSQFLIEAAVLTVAGGAVGIAVGLGLAFGGATALGWAFVPSVLAIYLGFGFSAVVGIFFGFYPAWSAARLPAVEALRYE